MKKEDIIINQDNNLFIISYDLKKTSKLTHKQFWENFIDLLLDEGAKGIGCYTQSTIIFSSPKKNDFAFWDSVVFEVFSEDLWYVLMESARRDVKESENREIGSFKAVRQGNSELCQNFSDIADERAKRRLEK